jgi:hypothetical protein
MAQRMGNYDPGRIQIIINGFLIAGYAPGSFVKVSRNKPSFTVKIGSDGLPVRTKSRDISGTITITLLQNSSSNDVLSGFVLTDEQVDGGTGAVGPALVNDLNGTTVYKSSQSWVQQPADGEFADEAGNREWTIACADLKMFSGGSVV